MVTTRSSSSIKKFQNNDDTLRKILSTSRTIALVGASDKKERPSNEVMEILLEYGYNVIPINPRLAGKKILGQHVYANLHDIPTGYKNKIDLVDIFRQSEACLEIVEDAISIQAKAVWMQICVINEDAAQKALQGGLDVAMNVCPAEEIPRLQILAPNHRSC